MNNKRYFFRVPAAFSLVICMIAGTPAHAQQPALHSLNVKSTKDIRNYFKYTGNDIPLVSGHRGGMSKGFPENSLATLENTLRHTPAFFEIDPRLTKDSVIIVFHDATLNRTSNGKGKVSDYTWEELKTLKLKDPEGNLTDYGIPTLDEVIQWSKGKTILNLDKKDVPFAMTLQKIKEHKAESHVMVTVHNAKEARFYYEANNDIMFSAHILTKEAFDEYEKSGVPWYNIMAYIGPRLTPQNKELMDLLHARGVMCMIGTGPSYDKIKDVEERKRGYREIIQAGANVIESDLPIDVAEAISSLAPAKSKKAKYFNKKNSVR